MARKVDDMASGAWVGGRSIDPRVRDAALDVARRHGLKVGGWLSDGALGAEGERIDLGPDEAVLTAGQGRRVAEALERLAARVEASDQRNQLTITALDRAVVGLAARLEETDTGAREEALHLLTALGELKGAQAALQAQIQDGSALAARERMQAALKAVEKQLAALSGHVHEAEARSVSDIRRTRADLEAAAARSEESMYQLRQRIEEQTAALRQEIDVRVRGVETTAQEAQRTAAGVRAEMAPTLAALTRRSEEADGRIALAVKDIEASVLRVSDRIDGAERAQRASSLAMEQAMRGLEDRLDTVADDEAIRIEIAEVRESLEARLAERTDEITRFVTEARADFAEQLTQALENERFNDLETAIVDVNRRIAAAEKRQAQTIEAVSVEIKRLSEALDRRLRAVEGASDVMDGALAAAAAAGLDRVDRRLADLDAREDALMDRLSAQVARLGERLDGPGSDQAVAVLDLTRQVTSLAERLNTQADDLASDFNAKLEASEARAASAIADLAARLTEKLNALAATADAPADDIPDLAGRLRAAEPEAEAPAPLASAPPPVEPAAPLVAPLAAPPYSTMTAFAAPRHEPPAAEPQPEPEDVWSLEQALDALDLDEQADDLALDEPLLNVPEKPPRAAAAAAESGAFEPPAFEPLSARRRDSEPGIDPLDPIDLFGETPEPDLRPSRRNTRDDYLEAARRAAKDAAAAQPRRWRPFAARRGTAAAGEAPPARRIASVAAVGTVGVLAAVAAGAYFATGAGGRAATAAAPAPLALEPPPPPGSIAAATAQQSFAATGEASETIAAAAARGEPVAQYELGVSLLNAGEAEEGVKFLRRAANQGLAMAQYRLATVLARGQDVEVDLAQARAWTERAAQGGNRDAMHDLGLFYARGEGAPLDEAAAFKWFRQAAEYGVTDSQFNLGVLYQQGRGVPADASEAYFWFLAAAASGDADAAARAAAAAERLGPERAAAVRARAAAFRPKPIDPTANGLFTGRTWAAPAAAPAREG